MKSKSHIFRKKWGQNFLTDSNLLDRIVRTVEPQENDNILEIGPGDGSLTELIFPKVEQMVVVEIDPLLIKHLSIRSDLNGLKIIHGDILLQEIEDLPINNPVRIIGNIPYNITSPIIFWLIDHLDSWDRAYLMVQKEVAQRLTGKIGTKDYSRVTVMTRLFFDIKICFSISPNVFIPRPKVQSAFISIEKRSDFNKNDVNIKKFSQVVRMAFNQRRKMLRNSLSTLNIDLDVCKVDFKRRPEQLTVSEFIDISNNII